MNKSFKAKIRNHEGDVHDAEIISCEGMRILKVHGKKFDSLKGWRRIFVIAALSLIGLLVANMLIPWRKATAAETAVQELRTEMAEKYITEKDLQRLDEVIQLRLEPLIQKMEDLGDEVSELRKERGVTR